MVTGLAAQYLGGCYFNSGRIKESIPWYKKGLECMLASGTGDHEDLGMSYEKVARCYTWEYEHDFARPDNLSGIAYCHYDLGVCRYHQALQARQNADKDAANALLKQSEEYLEKALASNMKMRGALAIDTIDNQEYLADVYKAQGRRGDASNAYMAVLTMVEDLLGPTHPRIADVKEKMRFT